MERRVTPPRRVTSPTWGPPPPCKQARNGQRIITHVLSNCFAHLREVFKVFQAVATVKLIDVKKITNLTRRSVTIRYENSDCMAL